MKRYWKLISILIVIVLVIGTFYIQSSMAASSYPKVTIESVSGNKDELKQITFVGELENKNILDPLEISLNGTNYHGFYSYWDQLLGENQHSVMKRFKKDYRNFMRGKIPDPSSFFENQNVIAYANLNWKTNYNGYQSNDFTLDVSVLDKTTDKETAFQLDLPVTGQYTNHVEIEELQVVQDQLKVIMKTYSYDPELPTEQTEIHVISVDIAAQEIVNEEVIEMDSLEIGSNQYLNSNRIGEDWTAISVPKQHILFQNVVSEERQLNEDEYTSEPISKDIYKYDLETGVQEKLELPDELKEGAATPESVNGNIVYFGERLANQLDITAFNFDSKKVESKHSIDLSQTEDLFYQIKGDKIFIVKPIKDSKIEKSIAVKDLQSGKALFEGKIEMKNENETSNKDYSLQIYGMENN